MKKKLSVVLVVVVVLAGGAWVGIEQLRKAMVPQADPSTPAVTGKKQVRFTFDGKADESGMPAPWQHRVVVGSFGAELCAGPSGGEKAIRLRCDKSHYLVFNAAMPFDPQEYPLASWEWKADVLPAGGDVRKSSLIPFVGDNRSDAVVQVLFGFEGNDVLSYIWDTTAPVDTEVQEPSPVATVRTRVVQSGAAKLGQWISHTVNIRDDYRRRFGKPPGRVIGLSVQANSNHTGSITDGYVSAITLTTP